MRSHRIQSILLYIFILPSILPSIVLAYFFQRTLLFCGSGFSLSCDVFAGFGLFASNSTFLYFPTLELQRNKYRITEIVINGGDADITSCRSFRGFFKSSDQYIPKYSLKAILWMDLISFVVVLSSTFGKSVG